MTSRYMASSSSIAAIVAAPRGPVRRGHGFVPGTRRGPGGRVLGTREHALMARLWAHAGERSPDMPRRATAWCLAPDGGPADMSCGEDALAAPAHQRECGPRQIAAGAS